MTQAQSQRSNNVVLVNASSPKLLDGASSNFAGARSYGLEGTGQYRISSLTVGHSNFKLCRYIGEMV